MFNQASYSGTLEENYELVLQQLSALVTGEHNLIANMANASALLNLFLDDINWVGFYLVENNELVLGPFQGLPACIRIPFHKGVCGHAALTRQSTCVDNVHNFPGHIACDGATNSEIVLPIIKDGNLVGVLDIDSPLLSRFSETDQFYLERFVDVLIGKTRS
ncbi:MAG: GAF domain-containing protein [Turicibacter sp.]